MTAAKIGLLGGTFDPVHYGHLQLAESALEECRLDKVVFIPAAEPPHKNGTSITSFRHRLAMLVLAGGGKIGFECNCIEEILPRPSYTIDTLRALRQQYPSDCSLFFMIGADAFLDILTWKDHQEILHSVDIILSRRRGYKCTQLYDFLNELGYMERQGCWYGKDDKKNIYLLDKTPEPFSSSSIRTMIGRGEPVHRFLPKSVVTYIENNKLYQLGKRETVLQP